MPEAKGIIMPPKHPFFLPKSTGNGVAEVALIHGDLFHASTITAKVILTTTTGESAQGLPEAGRAIICVKVIIIGGLSTQLSAKNDP